MFWQQAACGTSILVMSDKPGSKMLKLEEIKAGYGKRTVIECLTLSIGKGERLALVGPNGAGKSTLLKVIAGLIKTQSGRITYNGADITGKSTKWRVANGIAYLLQDKNVFPSISVLDNLSLAIIGLSRREKRERLDFIFSQFPDLKEWMGRRAGLLSGGQRQLLALAMVFITEPVLVLLDEPTAGLAPAVANDLFGIVERILGAREDLSVVLVEHRIDRVRQFSRRLALLSHGRLLDVIEDAASFLKDRRALEEMFFEKG